MLQSLGRPEVHMALDVVLVRGSGQEHEGCLLLTSEVLFVVSVSEDTQQQAFPVTEIDCTQDSTQNNLLILQLKQPRTACDVEVQSRKWGPGIAASEVKTWADRCYFGSGCWSPGGSVGERGQGSHPGVHVRASSRPEGFRPGAKPPDDLNKAWWSWAGVREWPGQDNGTPKRAGLCKEQDQGSKAMQLL